MPIKQIKEKELDRLFSLVIRNRDGWKCQYCGKQFIPPTNEIHNSHYYTRTKRSTRWDSDCCDAMCRKCHVFLESRKNAEYYDWKLKQLGEQRFRELRRRYATPHKWSIQEKNILYEELKEKIEQYERFSNKTD